MFLDRLSKFRLAGFPVGMFVTLEVAGGLAGLFKNFLSGITTDPRTASLIVNGGGAFLFSRMPRIRGFVGEELGADLMAAEFIKGLVSEFIGLDIKGTIAGIGGGGLHTAGADFSLPAAGAEATAPESLQSGVFGQVQEVGFQTSPSFRDTIIAVRRKQLEKAA